MDHSEWDCRLKKKLPTVIVGLFSLREKAPTKKREYYHLQQRVGLTVKEFQEMIANVENISMGPPNSESSMEQKKMKRIVQNDMGATDIKKQKTVDKKEWLALQLISKVFTTYKFCWCF